MARTPATIQPKILEYFRTAPVGEAALMLSLVQAEVHGRTTVMTLAPPAKNAAKKTAKSAKSSEKPAPNGAPAPEFGANSTPGEAVPIESVLG